MEQGTDGRIVPDEDRWEMQLADVAAFLAEHGRLPLQREGGKWLINQRHAVRQGRLSPHREQRLNDTLPGWQIDRRHRWWTRLGQVESFVAQHGRRPSKRSRDDHERMLGLWVDGQFGRNGAARRHPELEVRLRLMLADDDGKATLDTFTTPRNADRARLKGAL